MKLVIISLGLAMIANQGTSAGPNVAKRSLSWAPAPLPPIVLMVTAAGDAPRSLVAQTLDEAAAVWRPYGVTWTWRLSTSHRDADRAATIHVIIDDQPRESGATAGKPFGWIRFVAPDVPESTIHLSRANVVNLMMADKDRRDEPPDYRFLRCRAARLRAVRRTVRRGGDAPRANPRPWIARLGTAVTESRRSPLRSVFSPEEAAGATDRRAG